MPSSIINRPHRCTEMPGTQRNQWMFLWMVALVALLCFAGIGAPTAHAQSDPDSTVNLDELIVHVIAPEVEDGTTLVSVALFGVDPLALPGLRVAATVMTTDGNEHHSMLRPGASGLFSIPAVRQGEALALNLALQYGDAKRALEYDLTLLPYLAPGERILTNTSTARIDGSSIQNISLTATGEYSLRTSNDVGGPVYAWQDIVASGTPVTNLGDESYDGPFPIGFGFPFFDDHYESFYIASNGYIGFGPPVGYSGQYSGSFPSSYGPDNLVAWLMADLHQRSGSVHYQTLADRLIVQFTDYGWYSHSGETITAQIHLLATGDVELYYKEHSANAPVDEAIIGIEDSAGQAGLAAANNAAFIEPLFAVRFAYENARFVPQRSQIGATSGVTVTHPLLLVAPTHAPEPVNFAIDVTPDSWPISLAITETGPISPGSYISIPLTVVIPDTVGAQDGDIATISAQNLNGSTPYSATAQLSTCVPGCYDLRVSKSSTSQWIPGGLVNYTVHVENAGSKVVQGATLVDALPSEIMATNVNVSSLTDLDNQGTRYGAHTPTRSGSSLNFDLGEIEPGGHGDFTVNFRIPLTSTVGIPYTNTATITNTTGEVFPADNVAQVILMGSDGAPDMNPSISRLNGFLIPDSQVNFRFHWQNGNGLARNAVYTATLPAPMTLITHTHVAYVAGNWLYDPFPVTVDGQSLRWEMGNLPPNSNGYANVTVQLDNAYLGSATLVAEVASDNDVDLSNDLDSTTFTIAPPEADMWVTTAVSGSALVGGLATYNVNWQNRGTDVAERVYLTATLPPGTAFHGVSGYQVAPTYSNSVPLPSVNGNQVVWALGDIEPDWYGYLYLQAKLDIDLAAGVPLTNVVSVSPGVSELELANNTASAVMTSTIPADSDLGLTKTLLEPLVVGHEGLYRLTYQNQTTAPAVSVVITDRLPVDVSFVRAQWASAGSSYATIPITPTITPSADPAIEGDLLSFDLVQIPGRYDSGYYGYIDVVVAVAGATGVNKTNQSGVQAANDINAANDLAQVTASTVSPAYDVGLSVSRLDATVIDHQTRYNISLQNGGNAAMSGIVMTQTLPAGAIWVQTTDLGSGQLITPTAITADGSGRQVLRWEVGELERSIQSGSQRNYQLTVAIGGGGSVSVGDAQVFEVVAWGDQIELPNDLANFDNDLSSAQAAVRDLRVLKSFDENQDVIDGLTVRFDLEINNLGNLAANNVVLTDTLPAGLTYNWVSLPFDWRLAQTGNQVLIETSSLAPGATANISLYATVDAGSTEGETLVNQALIASDHS
jgi:uncharacterized repeat protein (TIGR01451 family)